ADAAGLLGYAAACGAVVVVCADLPARLLLAPVETPVGAWTALFGVPVGVALLKWRTPDRSSPAPAPGDRAALRKAER
ncbi:iron chelate uptake ABC transporter family permease subunit, partial [Streptomyces albidoflavus]